MEVSLLHAVHSLMGTIGVNRRYANNCYYRTANILLCVVIAKFTFGYSKKLFLSEKVQPKGKAVLITGCARGFGKLIAQHLDSKGFQVFASCLNPDSPGADDLRKSCSSGLQILQLDVTKDESVEKAVQFVKDNLGSSELWAVINNAGIQKGFLTELTRIQDFQDTMEVNTFGQVRVTKAFLPLLRKSRGRVINISSLAGRIALPMCGAYTMSKFASVGFTETLRHEVDMWGIKVISIEPEFFETDIVAGENIMMRVDDAFASADEDVRKDYGEEFLGKFKTVIGRAFPPSPNIHKLLEDIERAVSLKNPDAVYKIYRNPLIKFLVNVFESCPEECQVFLKNTYFRILGLPKPEEANKIYENYH
ncbi:Estradiol 17-beta-dehydrogenase 2 [Araneus ventricosus]|uniref:Estradiol 17-beta-dehydrogenase 2 n=1 Tax=Araneus ventricosus TaxID=182803 RepID=A0A4Y2P1Y6_ARAVE|nr:Estradiol 17-beta-dehydrogenase 2 [Araneus ventricosus]